MDRPPSRALPLRPALPTSQGVAIAAPLRSGYHRRGAAIEHSGMQHDGMSSSDGTVRAEARTGQIKIHGAAAFEGMRRAGRLAALTLDFITPHVVPGVTTGDLDRLCHGFVLDHGGISAPLNYRGFPKSICTSINHVVCHGIPGDRRLMEGDIMNIDVTPILDGWHGDSSRMFLVGDRVPVKARKLVDVTYEAMMRGIAVVRPGVRTGAIGDAIQRHAESQRFSVVRDFCGHGTGRVFHDAPSILHYGRPEDGPILREGMFFTIEPMINAGRYDVKILSDGWTAVTKDKSLSAQFEHTIGVTATGCEIFTVSPAGLHRPPYQLNPAETSAPAPLPA
jgi:methionyl aminopeptidase